MSGWSVSLRKKRQSVFIHMNMTILGGLFSSDEVLASEGMDHYVVQSFRERPRGCPVSVNSLTLAERASTIQFIFGLWMWDQGLVGGITFSHRLLSVYIVTDSRRSGSLLVHITWIGPDSFALLFSPVGSWNHFQNFQVVWGLHLEGKDLVSFLWKNLHLFE